MEVREETGVYLSLERENKRRAFSFLQEDKTTTKTLFSLGKKGARQNWDPWLHIIMLLVLVFCYNLQNFTWVVANYIVR